MSHLPLLEVPLRLGIVLQKEYEEDSSQRPAKRTTELCLSDLERMKPLKLLSTTDKPHHWEPAQSLIVKAQVLNFLAHHHADSAAPERCNRREGAHAFRVPCGFAFRPRYVRPT